MPPGVRSRLLLVAHLGAAGVLGAYCYAKGGQIPAIQLAYLPIAAVLALTSAQAGLLGVWVAASSRWWGVRLLVLAVGSGTLEFLNTVDGNGELFFPLAVAGSTSVAALGLIVRTAGGGLRVPTEESTFRSGAPLRVSIRGIMLLTLLVAGALGGLRAFHGSADGLWGSMIILGLIHTALTSASCWAVLTAGRPGVRVPVVVLGSVLCGLLLGVALPEVPDWERVVYLLMIEVGQTAVVLASLLVVRSAGYRLAWSVARGSIGAPVAEAAGGAA
jgi:hypothetical protein